MRTKACAIFLTKVKCQQKCSLVVIKDCYSRVTVEVNELMADMNPMGRHPEKEQIPMQLSSGFWYKRLKAKKKCHSNHGKTQASSQITAINPQGDRTLPHWFRRCRTCCHHLPQVLLLPHGGKMARKLPPLLWDTVSLYHCRSARFCKCKNLLCPYYSVGLFGR